MMQEGKSRGRRRYGDDLRRRVLIKLASGEASLRGVSKEFGVSVPTLIKWRKEDGPPVSVPGSGPKASQSSSAVENQRLREEIERLTEERDRLRRSIAMLVGVKITD